MSIKESALTAITTITNSDLIRAVTSAGASRRITVSNLAKHFIENYAGSSLAGSSQSVKSALDSIGGKTSGWRIAVYGVNNSASVEIPLDNTTRGFFFTAGAGSTARGIQGFGVNASGGVSSSQLVTASGLTFTNGTNKVTVANSSGAYASIFVLWS